MAQPQEYFLYLGRDPKAAQHLHQILVQMLDTPSVGAPLSHAESDRRNGHTGVARSNGALPSAKTPVETPTADTGSGLTQNDGTLPLQVVSNQKLALRFVQSNATRLLAVETTAKVSSRQRFCAFVRQRAPSACIVAVGPIAEYHFLFDMVLDKQPELRALRQVADLVRKSSAESVIARGPVTLNALTRRVTTPAGEFDMTPKQCSLLLLLMRHSNQVVSRSDIMRTIWETNYLEDTRTLDVHVRWLRMMIEPDPAQPTLLVTQRGVGYQFVEAVER